MYLEPGDRRAFAQEIIDAIIEKTGATSIEEDKAARFINEFSRLEGLKIEASHEWMGKIVDWVKAHPSEMLKEIKTNYKNPRPVLQKIIEYKHPY